MGIFPNANAHEDRQHECSTSLYIKAIAGNFHYDWCDLFYFSPDTEAKYFNQKKAASMIKNRTALGKLLALYQWSRGYDRVKESRNKLPHYLPVLIWVGETVNLSFEWLCELGVIPKVISSYSTPFCRISIP